MIHPTFTAAMAQRMGLPSGRRSREVSAYRLVADGKFAGFPGVLMNLSGLRWPARGYSRPLITWVDYRWSHLSRRQCDGPRWVVNPAG